MTYPLLLIALIGIAACLLGWRESARAERMQKELTRLKWYDVPGRWSN